MAIDPKQVTIQQAVEVILPELKKRLIRQGLLAVDLSKIPQNYEAVYMDGSFFLAYQEIYLENSCSSRTVVKRLPFDDLTTNRKVEHSYRYELAVTCQELAKHPPSLTLCEDVKPRIESVMLEEVIEKPKQPTTIGLTPMDVWMQIAKAKYLQSIDRSSHVRPENSGEDIQSPHFKDHMQGLGSTSHNSNCMLPHFEILIHNRPSDLDLSSNEFRIESEDESFLEERDRASQTSHLGKRGSLITVTPSMDDPTDFCL